MTATCSVTTKGLYDQRKKRENDVRGQIPVCAIHSCLKLCIEND